MITEPLAFYDWARNEFRPRIFSDWSIDGDIITVTVSDEYEWTNGDPVTVEDLKLWFELHDATQAPVTENYVKEWTQNGNSLELTLYDASINNQILKHQILGKSFMTPRATWKEHVEELRDTSGDAYDSKVQQILNMRIESDEVISCGAFKVDDVAQEQKITLVPHDGHPHHDQIEIPAIEVKLLSGNTQFIQGLRNHEIDGNNNQTLSPSTHNNFPDTVVGPIWRPRGMNAGTLVFNLETDWNTREFRKAVSYMTDIEAVAGNVNRPSMNTRFVGIANKAVVDNWLSGKLDGFTDYAGKQYDKAAEQLREAGFTEGSDWWKSPDGSVFEPQIDAPAEWSGPVNAMRSYAGQMQEFGIKAEVNALDTNQWLEEVANTGNYDLSFDVLARGVQAIPHPLTSYTWVWNSMPAQEQHGVPIDYETEIPMPVGDPDGDLQTVRPPEIVDELQRTNDSEEQENLVLKLAWIFNQDPPFIGHTISSNPGWLNAEEFEFPEIEDLRNPPDVFTAHLNHELIEQGHLTPKYE